MIKQKELIKELDRRHIFLLDAISHLQRQLKVVCFLLGFIISSIIVWGVILW